MIQRIHACRRRDRLGMYDLTCSGHHHIHSSHCLVERFEGAAESSTSPQELKKSQWGTSSLLSFVNKLLPRHIALELNFSGSPRSHNISPCGQCMSFFFLRKEMS